MSQHVFIEKQTRTGREPAGELVFDGKRTVLYYGDFNLMRVITALFSKSMCHKHEADDGKVTKAVATHKLPLVLEKLRRPYFFGEHHDRLWKFSKVLS